MIFNSISFFLFFSIVFFLYYFLLRGNSKAQNLMLLLSSYIFYGIADWKMLPLIFISSVIIFFLGSQIAKTSNAKKASILATLGLLIALGLLMYFKYFNFFIASFTTMLNTIGLKANIGTFNILMPLGISFFTFKLISYIIEIQRGKIQHCTNFVEFALYISFFPTILSGPIDKPNTFIPQLQKKRFFDYHLVTSGCKQILWGLFQKMVIADNLAVVVNNVWGDIPNQHGSILFITAILFSFQIYTDFSGYSHMAIGVGKILGFHITKNFKTPYFSKNVAEFWRNWHISLTSWVSDYVFMPLSMNFRNIGSTGIILAILINMIVVGLWHGAKWNYVLFGLYNGILFIPSILSGTFLKQKKVKISKYNLPLLANFFKITSTFSLITFGLIIFRAENATQAWQYMSNIFNLSSPFEFRTIGLKHALPSIIFAVFLFIVEWIYSPAEHPLALLGIRWKKLFRWTFYAFIIFLIGMFSQTIETPFIYFQF